MMGSCSMQATCGGHHEIFSYASTAGTLQEGSHVGTGWICEHLCTRMVSLRYNYSTGIALGRVRPWKKGNNRPKHIINELIVYYRFWYFTISLSLVWSHFQGKRAPHIKTPSSTLCRFLICTFSTRIRYPASRPHCESSQ